MSEKWMCANDDCRNELAVFLSDRTFCRPPSCSKQFCSQACLQVHENAEHPGEVRSFGKLEGASAKSAEEKAELKMEPLLEELVGKPTVDDTKFEEAAEGANGEAEELPFADPPEAEEEKFCTRDDPSCKGGDHSSCESPSHPCADCGVVFPDWRLEVAGDDLICSPCERERYEASKLEAEFACDGCGTVFKESKLTTFEDAILCLPCKNGWKRATELQKAKDSATPPKPDRERLHGLVVHPAANLVPMMSDGELEALGADIRVNGLRQPIVLTAEEELLDGRNRLVACERAGVEIPAEWFTTWDGVGDPVAFVLSANLHRRHLSESQRALVGARAKELFEEDAAARRRSTQNNDTAEAVSADLREQGKASEKAAELVNVSARSVESASKVLREGARELVDAVERGDASVSAASELADLPDEEQKEIVARGPKEIRAKAKELAKKDRDERKEKRLDRLATISEKSAPLAPTGKLYPVILADPPWKYSFSKVDCWSVEEHYPTMTVEEICAMRVAEMATPDAVLLLWTTSPKLLEALRVIEAWGFTYVTQGIWDKSRTGMGYWFHQQHEILLVATRGEMPTPPEGTRRPSVIHAPRGLHSAKPDAVREILELWYPKLPKLELFARGSARTGWATWGNQAQAGEDGGAMTRGTPIAELLPVSQVVNVEFTGAEYRELDGVAAKAGVNATAFVKQMVLIALRVFAWFSLSQQAPFEMTPKALWKRLLKAMHERELRISSGHCVEVPCTDKACDRGCRARPVVAATLDREPGSPSASSAKGSDRVWKPGVVTTRQGGERVVTRVASDGSVSVQHFKKSGARGAGSMSPAWMKKCRPGAHELPPEAKTAREKDHYFNCRRCRVTTCRRCLDGIYTAGDALNHPTFCKKLETAPATKSARAPKVSKASSKPVLCRPKDCPGHELSQRVMQGGKVFSNCILCGAYCCKYCKMSIAGAGVSRAHNRVCEKRPRAQSSQRKAAKATSTTSSQSVVCEYHEMEAGFKKRAGRYFDFVCKHCKNWFCRACGKTVDINKWAEHCAHCAEQRAEVVKAEVSKRPALAEKTAVTK